MINTASASGNAMGTPTFINVSGAEYPLQAIIPNGENVPSGETGDGMIEIRKLTSEAQAVDGIWYWMDYTEEVWGEVTTYYGWYDALGETYSPTTFKPGEGFWAMFPKGASATFQYSGEVKATDAFYPMNEGNTAMGNPFPYNLNVFTKIVPIGEDEEGHSIVPTGETGDNMIELRKLTANAQADGGIWFWMNYEEEVWGETTVYYGWYDALGETECPYDLTPGQGIWVKCPVEGCSLQFKHADL